MSPGRESQAFGCISEAVVTREQPRSPDESLQVKSEPSFVVSAHLGSLEVASGWGHPSALENGAICVQW